jgi:hypothetical protein
LWRFSCDSSRSLKLEGEDEFSWAVPYVNQPQRILQKIVVIEKESLWPMKYDFKIRTKILAALTFISTDA